MEVIVNQELLDEVNLVIENGLVEYLNQQGISYSAMCFILQILVNAIDEAQERLDNEEN